MKKILMAGSLFLLFTLTLPIAVTAQGNGAPIEPNEDRSYFVSIGSLAIPLIGSIYVTCGKALSDRVILSNHFTFFNRDWMILLEKGDWNSRSAYFGPMFQYFPFSKKNEYKGYFIGIDTGLAISRQTYRPVNKSDTFFFGFIDLYFMGYRMSLNRIYKGLNLDFTLGGGWAPVSHEVKIDGHVNEGDFYPLADVRVLYKW